MSTLVQTSLDRRDQIQSGDTWCCIGFAIGIIFAAVSFTL